MEKNKRGNTLRKSERLFEKKSIENVFDIGRSFMASPVRILWVFNKKETTIPVKAGFTVPGRNFRRAVDRNLLKRRMKEAFRKNKSELVDALTEKHLECQVMFIYAGRAKAPYSEIESKIVVTLQHLVKNIVNEKAAGVHS